MKILSFITLTFFFLLTSCGSNQPLETVQIDVEQYKGTWYEIARLPNRFEKGLDCVTANYTLKENGKIKVINRGYNIEKEKQSESIGEAKPAGEKFKSGKLKVSFFKPFYGDYYVIDLGENYEYALVGNPSRKYLWILAREPSLPLETVELLKETASEKGFAVEELYYTKQDCDNN